MFSRIKYIILISLIIACNSNKHIEISTPNINDGIKTFNDSMKSILEWSNPDYSTLPKAQDKFESIISKDKNNDIAKLYLSAIYGINRVSMRDKSWRDKSINHLDDLIYKTKDQDILKCAMILQVLVSQLDRDYTQGSIVNTYGSIRNIKNLLELFIKRN